MVAINYPQIPIYMHFLVELQQRTFIFLINIDRNLHSLVYISITSPYFYFAVILKQHYNNSIFAGKCGLYLEYLILDLPNKKSGSSFAH